jgi:HK97 family phage major capsid protein
VKIADLSERRALLVSEMRSITEKPAGQGGDLSAEQSQRFDGLKTELESIEKSINRQRLIDEAERRMQGEPISGGDRRFDEACREFSLRAAIAGAAGLNVEWGRERELGVELARRAGRAPQGFFVPMSVFHQPLEQRVVTGAGEGANIIGTDLRGDQFIDALRAKMVVRRLGARVLGGLVGNVDIPKLIASPSSAWVADNGALSASDPNLDKVQLTPKHAGVITEFSRNTLLQSSPDIEQLLRMDFASLLAQALDKVAIAGGGSNQPSGVLASGLNTSVTMGASPTWAKVLEIVEKVEMGNAEGSAWVTTPSVVRKLRSTAKVGSTDSVMIQESPNALAGFPLVATNNVPGDLTASPQIKHRLIFGDWSDVLIGFWSELDVLVNPYESTAYSKGNVQIRGMMTCSVAVRHAEAFAACIDLVP